MNRKKIAVFFLMTFFWSNNIELSFFPEFHITIERIYMNTKI